MSMQTLLLSAALVFFGVIATIEFSKSIHQKIRLRRDKAASAPHRGEESTWNELTEHHRPVRHSEPEEFTAGPHERLLAICAPYSLCRRDPWDRLACSDLDGTRTMLSLDWGVRSRTDLLSRIYWLITSGHRSGFNAERARWVDTSLAEAERHELRESSDSSSDASETLWRLGRMLNNDRDIRNVDFSAWDLVRAAMLTRCGFALGWLTEDETWDTLTILDRGLRERYRSWTQMSESFRLARWYWNSKSGKDEHFNDLHDLNRSLVLLSPDGPWGIIDWDIDTPEPSFLILDDLLDTGVAMPLGAGERKRATQWERWVDDQVILRGQHRPQHFGTRVEQHHRFTKRA